MLLRILLSLNLIAIMALNLWLTTEPTPTPGGILDFMYRNSTITYLVLIVLSVIATGRGWELTIKNYKGTNRILGNALQWTAGMFTFVGSFLLFQPSGCWSGKILGLIPAENICWPFQLLFRIPMPGWIVDPINTSFGTAWEGYLHVGYSLISGFFILGFLVVLLVAILIPIYKTAKWLAPLVLALALLYVSSVKGWSWAMYGVITVLMLILWFLGLWAVKRWWARRGEKKATTPEKDKGGDPNANLALREENLELREELLGLREEKPISEPQKNDRDMILLQQARYLWKVTRKVSELKGEEFSEPEPTYVPEGVTEGDLDQYIKLAEQEEMTLLSQQDDLSDGAKRRLGTLRGYYPDFSGAKGPEDHLEPLRKRLIDLLKEIYERGLGGPAPEIFSLRDLKQDELEQRIQEAQTTLRQTEEEEAPLELPELTLGQLREEALRLNALHETHFGSKAFMPKTIESIKEEALGALCLRLAEKLQNRD